jgi:Immunoglobulin domain
MIPPVLPKLKQFNTDEEPLYYEESFQLFCSVIHGDSPFAFQWLFQNKTVEHFYDVKVENGKKKSGLTIDSVSAKHAGEYTCKVTNEAGFTAISTTLVVKGWLFHV